MSPPAEIAILWEDGNRLKALVRPSSPDDENFLAVDRDEAAPETVAEWAWVRPKGRREFEREKGYTPPPPQNYGMVEFDPDRWW